MFDKWRKYSYVVQKSLRYRMFWIFFCFLALYVLYNVFTSFFFSMRALENETMRPGLHAGDRYIVASFSVYSLLSGFSADEDMPFKRGNVVIVDLASREKKTIPLRIIDGAVRFFTAQRIGFSGYEERVHIKRVIGLPGDEITMTNFVLRVKPRGSSYNLTEFELSDKAYDVNIPQVPALWDDAIPFAGNMDRIILKENEYFVLSDDRSNTNDSRTWGPLQSELITGKVMLRYWPFTRLGRP
jgi:signal peptidase I